MNVQSDEVGHYLIDMLPYLDLSISDINNIETGFDSEIDEKELFDGIKDKIEKAGYKDAKNLDRVHNLDNSYIYRDLIFNERYGNLPDKYEDDIKNSWVNGFDRYIENK